MKSQVHFACHRYLSSAPLITQGSCLDFPGAIGLKVLFSSSPLRIAERFSIIDENHH
jgi:hypothetical protein